MASRNALFRRILLQAALAASGLIAVASIAACHRPLFPENQPRTPFEVHDRLRNRWTPLETTDVFGNPRPALRARLSRPIN